jgi:hypothetical protein
LDPYDNPFWEKSNIRREIERDREREKREEKKRR